MKEIIVTITDEEGMILFETSTAEIRNELEEENPGEKFEIRAGDVLDALKSELGLPHYQS